MANMVKIIENGAIGENDIILFEGSTTLMCMTEKVVTGFYLHDAFEQRGVAPMGAS